MFSAKFMLVSVFAILIFGINCQDKLTYRAGVVEYYPSQNEDFYTKVQNNLDAYLKFIDNATKENTKVDILVFPEATLNGGIKTRKEAKAQTVVVDLVASKAKDAKDVNQMPDVIKELSNKAKERKVYVVVNLSEKELCSKDLQQQHNDDRPCATDALNFYNTDVVFDRDGKIVARYRKFNLFSEKAFNTTKRPEFSTFVTDFDVQFGLFTCFDILFNDPPLTLVRRGVKDFIFPTMWFSELPFLTARQMQEYWAYSNDVNLLAAGASNTKLGSGGSGIYAGKMGPIITYMSKPQKDGEEDKNSMILFADVPILAKFVPEEEVATTVKPDGTNKNVYKTRRSVIDREVKSKISKNSVLMDKFKMIRDNINEYASEKIMDNRFEKEICNNNLCCTFNVTSNFLNKTESETFYYQYRAVVGDVIRSFSGMANGGIKTCGIVACSGDTIESCGVRFNDSSKVGQRQIFEQIHIEGMFPYIQEVFTMPNTLSHSMLPLSNDRFVYHELKKPDEDQKFVTMDLRGLPEAELQTFAIFGRDFRYDGNGASTLTKSFTLLLAVFIMKYLIAN